MIEKEARNAGCEGLSFQTLAAGPSRSYGIHAFPNFTTGSFGSEGLSILDFGVSYNGYASDVTLTVATGTLLPEQEQQLKLIQEAYELALSFYKAGNPVADKWVELKYDNNWTATFQYLPPANDYSVKELRKAESGETPEFTINNVNYVGVNSGSEASVGNGDTAIKYVVSYSQLTQDTTDPSLSTVTITNRAQWQLIKYSSSDEEKSKGLEGAEFELKHNTDNTIYKGVSYANGIVKWTKNNAEFTGVFPDGSYTLTETAAPTGYMLGDPVEFTMMDGVPLSMSDENAVIKDGILTFYYANEILYTLPSTGGPGIHWYIIGGMLLMTAGALVLYKRKRRGVL